MLVRLLIGGIYPKVTDYQVLFVLSMLRLCTNQGAQVQPVGILGQQYRCKKSPVNLPLNRSFPQTYRSI